LNINVLYLGGSEQDAGRATAELERGGIQGRGELAGTIAEFEERVAAGEYDVVLADNDFPGGAADLVYKDRLALLPAAVHRAQKMLRDARCQAEAALRAANRILTALIRGAPVVGPQLGGNHRSAGVLEQQGGDVQRALRRPISKPIWDARCWASRRRRRTSRPERNGWARRWRCTGR
jgi:hypothetical protein